MLWIKSLHIIFVVTWFAGLFYLPRLFVYHCQCESDDERGNQRFKTMERKLFAIMTIGALGALLFGLWMLQWFALAFTASLWLSTKLALVVALLGFHLWCGFAVRAFRDDRNQHSERFFRLINEVPAVALIAIVILVVVKPF